MSTAIGERSSLVNHGNWVPLQETCKPFYRYDNTGKRVKVDETVSLIMDKSTGEKYLNISSRVRKWCVCLTLAVPVLAVISIIILIARLLIGANFWCVTNKGFNKNNFLATARDLGEMVVLPFAALGYVAASIAGIVSPNNGRKMMVRFEQMLSKTPLQITFAPYIFTPNPEDYSIELNVIEKFIS